MLLASLGCVVYAPARGATNCAARSYRHHSHADGRGRDGRRATRHAESWTREYFEGAPAGARGRGQVARRDARRLRLVRRVLRAHRPRRRPARQGRLRGAARLHAGLFAGGAGPQLPARRLPPGPEPAVARVVHANYGARTRARRGSARPSSSPRRTTPSSAGPSSTQSVDARQADQMGVGRLRRLQVHGLQPGLRRDRRPAGAARRAARFFDVGTPFIKAAFTLSQFAEASENGGRAKSPWTSLPAWWKARKDLGSTCRGRVEAQIFSPRARPIAVTSPPAASSASVHAVPRR